MHEILIHDHATEVFMYTRRMHGVPREGDTIRVANKECKVMSARVRWGVDDWATAYITVEPIGRTFSEVEWSEVK